ncbi:MAG: hypothetical protein DBX47_05200 [Clostridiales bacterium]|nr:MAG: hypothetical protein DBX47_05200 [Clostridiales bacterium]
MKKIITYIFLIFILLSLSSCSQKSTVKESTETNAEQKTQEDIINITEKLYVTYINEIYTNTSDYVGKTIKIEGMFTYEEAKNQKYYYVYRTGPGCCGNDGSMCGFEFTYDKGYPNKNDWIEVIGKLRTYDEGGYTYLTLDAESVTVKQEHGAETVYN